MPKTAHASSPQIVHVSIRLDKVVPEVSRVVAVPLGICLDTLHLIIQTAMGWTDTHLWLMQAGGLTWGVPDPDFPDDTIPANRTLLLDMIADIGATRFRYIYDFGDHWSHTIKIGPPMPAIPGVDYPLLFEAVGRCPLEDSGGAAGYREMLDALRDPAHPRHAEVMERPGPNFDPNDANRTKLEKHIAGLARMMTTRRRAPMKSKRPRKRRNPSDNELF